MGWPSFGGVRGPETALNAWIKIFILVNYWLILRKMVILPWVGAEWILPAGRFLYWLVLDYTIRSKISVTGACRPKENK